MLISKSLFVDYKEFPKLAWWKQNNLNTYKKIRWLEDEDMTLIQDSYKTKRNNNLKRTIEAIKNKELLIYQPWFLIDNLFVRWDYLKLNENWSYDLI